MSDNPGLVEMPPQIEMLVSLKTLRFNGNGISELPVSLLSLRKLDSLELNKNKFSQFYSESQIDMAGTILEGLTYLSLNGNQLTMVP